jgi:hypothetical protein
MASSRASGSKSPASRKTKDISTFRQYCGSFQIATSFHQEVVFGKLAEMREEIGGIVIVCLVENFRCSNGEILEINHDLLETLFGLKWISDSRFEFHFVIGSHVALTLPERKKRPEQLFITTRLNHPNVTMCCFASPDDATRINDGEDDGLGEIFIAMGA